MKKTDFANWLQDQLESRDMSQAELARRAGVTRAAISGVLTGARGIGTDLCTAIADAFGYPPETVFRAAGLLPPIGKEAAEYEKWKAKLARLTPENRERLWRFLEVELEHQEQEERSSVTHSRKQKGAPSENAA